VCNGSVTVPTTAYGPAISGAEWMVCSTNVPPGSAGGIQLSVTSPATFTVAQRRSGGPTDCAFNRAGSMASSNTVRTVLSAAIRDLFTILLSIDANSVPLLPGRDRSIRQDQQYRVGGTARRCTLR